MYPRAEAYIISVKQSTYCQFGEVIRAHTERGEGERGGMAGWKKRKGRQEMAEEVRERAEAYECKKQQEMKMKSALRMLFKKRKTFCARQINTSLLTETMKLKL